MEPIKENEIADLLSTISEFIEKEIGDNQEEQSGFTDYTPSTFSKNKINERGETKLGFRKETCEKIVEKLCGHYHVKFSLKSYRKDKDWKIRISEVDETLKELAQKLALNMIDVSVRFSDRDGPHEKILRNPKILGKRHNHQRERFVAIIGAGASHIATGKLMPQGNTAAKLIRKEIEEEQTVIHNFIERELDHLRHNYGLDRNELETVLMACSKFDRDKVLEKLQTICNANVKHLPSLLYEIIAHMFKHRFIDIIINFNYDEILDDIIKEEINDGEYRYIYSDGHCPNENKDLLISNRIKQPVYLKPHGTISHQSSIRFTREDFFTIPTRMRETLRYLLEGKVNGVDYQDTLPINLIVIGCSLKSETLLSVLRDILEKKRNNQISTKIKCWIFDINNRVDDFGINQLFDLYKEERPIEVEFIKLENKENALEKKLLQLWEMVSSNFNEEYKPRGIERHRLINKVFKHSPADLTGFYPLSSDLTNYYRSRFYVELVLAYLESDGILNHQQIAESRAGIYLELYNKSTNISNKTYLRDWCSDLGLDRYKGFIWDAYIFRNARNYHDKDILLGDFYRNLLLRLDEKYRIRLENEGVKKKFLSLGKVIHQKNSMKITPKYKQLHNHLFKEISNEDILNTYLNWVYKFHKVIADHKKWDLVLSISEKGKFLLGSDLITSRPEKKLGLVLSSYNSTKFEDPDLGSYGVGKSMILEGSIRYLPWWLHNQHVILFLSLKNKEASYWRDQWSLQHGFYYESRQLSRRINPVYVKNEDDLFILLQIFTTYWDRARSYKSDSGAITLPIIQSAQEMDAGIQKLLDLYFE